MHTLMLLALWLLFASFVWAIPPQIQHYFGGLYSLRSDFIQRVYDRHSHVVQISSGRMLIQKPSGKFRCDYWTPSKQIIIADGDRLWAYDVALAQVTVRKLDKALNLASPMVLLSGNIPIEEAFIIGKAYEKDGLTWYKLEPKQQRVEFSSLRVAFNNELLFSLEIEDESGQHTFIDFQKLELNPAIDPSLLKFIPPPGVDVVGDSS